MKLNKEITYGLDSLKALEKKCKKLLELMPAVVDCHSLQVKQSRNRLIDLYEERIYSLRQKIDSLENSHLDDS